MYVLFLLGLIAYTITGAVKNILFIVDYFRKRTESHNKEVVSNIKKLAE